jgi:hypothetical protein
LATSYASRLDHVRTNGLQPTRAAQIGRAAVRISANDERHAQDPKELDQEGRNLDVDTSEANSRLEVG